MKWSRCFMLAGLAALICPGCDKPDASTAAVAQSQPGDAAKAPTNRIDVPPAVRQNLGITFAKVERRRVASTLRVPGHFELTPTARRQYRATLSGWVDVLVEQYDGVDKGTPIYRMDSPEWHRLRKQLHESQAGIEAATAALAVAQQSKVEVEATVKVLERRTEALAGAEVRRAELESELAARRASIPRLDAEIRVKQAALNEAKHDFTLEIDSAASLLGVPAKLLTSTVEPEADDAEHDDGHKLQRWFTISQIERAAVGPGVVESLHVTDGSWVEPNAVVATTVDPTAIRFRASGLQSDLGRLREGLGVSILPPQGVGIDATSGLPGTLRIGLGTDPESRTVELFTTPETSAGWARAGVSAFLEIYTDDSGPAELAIPTAAVVSDGLRPVFFRRDPKNPDVVVRTEADLGVSDGRWVIVKSGVKEGDEVVLEGVYELKLTGASAPQGRGHFHADGTWHAEGEPEPK